MKILIAEDDSVSRRLLQANLIDWGYEVMVAENGADALRLIENDGLPPLVILDVMMPETDGFEVCRKLREVKTDSPPYIIMLTAKQEKEDVVKGIELGADDYLTKPFNRNELRVRIDVGVRTITLQNSLAERVKELEGLLAQVKKLEGMLPICSYCKHIRDDKNYWQSVENYITSRSEAIFSHSICPDCYDNTVKPMLDRHLEKRRQS
jgi:DNA-binding response OmpR family regulator